MNFKVITTSKFDKEIKKLAKKYRKIKGDFEDLIKDLEKDPSKGTLLFDKIYKIRMKNSDVSKGKSSGYRVIFYVLTENLEVYLLSIYSKLDKENISEKEIEEILKGIYFEI